MSREKKKEFGRRDEQGSKRATGWRLPRSNERAGGCRAAFARWPSSMGKATQSSHLTPPPNSGSWTVISLFEQASTCLENQYGTN